MSIPTVMGTLSFKGARVVVPAALRHQILDCLHDSHQGTEAIKRGQDRLYSGPASTQT